MRKIIALSSQRVPRFQTDGSSAGQRARAHLLCREAAGLRRQRARTGRETGRGAEGGGQGHRLRVAEAAEQGQRPNVIHVLVNTVIFQLSVFPPVADLRSEKLQ